MKLSKKQKEVVGKMKEGYDILGYVPRAIGKTAILYKGGVSTWTNVYDVPYRTFQILLENKIVKFTEKYMGIDLYNLTELGKSIKID